MEPSERETQICLTFHWLNQEIGKSEIYQLRLENQVFNHTSDLNSGCRNVEQICRRGLFLPEVKNVKQIA